MLAPWKKSYDKPREYIKKQRHYFVDKSPYSQSYGFPSSRVRMWKLDRKEGWVPKNWCIQTVVLEKTLENPLDCKEIKAASPKGNQPWIFIGRIDAEAEAPILRPTDEKSQLVGKDPNAGKDWGQKEKGTTEDKMVGSHHWLNGHEFEQTLGDIEGQGDSEGPGSLACCNPQGRKESDMTYQLTTTKCMFSKALETCCQMTFQHFWLVFIRPSEHNSLTRSLTAAELFFICRKPAHVYDKNSISARMCSHSCCRLWICFSKGREGRRKGSWGSLSCSIYFP